MSGEWHLAHDCVLPLDRPRLMGILNLTPDSFSDGGQFADPGAAVDHALRMVDEGAEIIDVGGESTRPGAAAVRADEQVRRVIPVIEKLASQADVLISIDTTRAAVARCAIEAGAAIINDVSAGLDDDAMLSLASETQAGLILMHRLRPPSEDSFSDQYESPPEYSNVVREVGIELGNRARAAEEAGVRRASIVLDPGLGFGKTVRQNYELIQHSARLLQMGYPLLCAASRKSFIGHVAGVETPSQRIAGSVAVAVVSFMMGVRLFRVHDVRAHHEALLVAEAIMR